MKLKNELSVLCLTRYGRLGASSRLRTLQFIPWLEANGFKVTVSPLFDDLYVERLYAGQIAWPTVIKGYARRVARLLDQMQFDVIWLEKEALPWIPAFFERLLLQRAVPYVADYDDAVFHYYDIHRNPIVRAVLADKVDQVMHAAKIVSAGNPYLALRARAAGAPRVEIVPTVVDLTRYQIIETSGNGPPAIGWIGSPGTAGFLGLIETTVAEFVNSGRARMVAVGVSKSPLPSLPIELRPWSEASEVSEIQRFDIGVMPLPDEPFERGKCGYKLIQYMACGKPVIASPVGVNRDIVQHGVNGFLAETESEWLNATRRLVDDPGLRARMGREGRRIAEVGYSLQATAQKVGQLLRDAAGTRSTSRER
jgi:glycosyltransferase involved in cell wall biosynthesis